MNDGTVRNATTAMATVHSVRPHEGNRNTDWLMLFGMQRAHAHTNTTYAVIITAANVMFIVVAGFLSFRYTFSFLVADRLYRPD